MMPVRFFSKVSTAFFTAFFFELRGDFAML
jgi:hypothetical protein